MKRWFLAPALALAMAVAIYADPQSVPDPSKDYPITPEAGPWVIVAASYSGPDAADLTRQLVTYLRNHQLPAYVNYNHADANRAQLEADKKRWKEQYPDVPFRHEPIVVEDQYSVLIGGFQDMESASDYMKKVLKDPKTPLPPLKLPGKKEAYEVEYHYQTDANGRIVIDEKTKEPKLVRGAFRSPFASSFVTRNPTLSAAKMADPFLKKLNAEEEYSLLNCPAPWTMFVKSYSAGATYVSETRKPQEPSMTASFLSSLWGSDKPTSEVLNASAMQAHETASVLRKLGFEAYVLHTRHNSIVTIGGFKDQADPAMIRTAERLAALKLDALHLPRDFHSCEVPRP